MVASSDEGTSFTHAAYVDDPSNINNGGFHSSVARYVEPALTVSQGSATVPGGQVTLVYDDYGTGNTAGTPYDRIIDQTDLEGGTSATIAGPTNVPIAIATLNPVSGQPDIAATTDIPIGVAITNPGFASLQALDVTAQDRLPRPVPAQRGFNPAARRGHGVAKRGGVQPQYHAVFQRGERRGNRHQQRDHRGQPRGDHRHRVRQRVGHRV